MFEVAETQDIIPTEPGFYWARHWREMNWSAIVEISQADEWRLWHIKENTTISSYRGYSLAAYVFGPRIPEPEDT